LKEGGTHAPTNVSHITNFAVGLLEKQNLVCLGCWLKTLQQYGLLFGYRTSNMKF